MGLNLFMWSDVNDYASMNKRTRSTKKRMVDYQKKSPKGSEYHKKHYGKKK